MQKMTDKRRKNTGSQLPSSLYIGAHCTAGAVPRGETDFRRRTKEDNPNAQLKYFCWGFLNVLSGDMIKKVNQVCPYHCEGLARNDKFSDHSTCFYKFEDNFFGSCVATIPGVKAEKMPKSIANHRFFRDYDLQNRASFLDDLAIHTNDTLYTYEQSTLNYDLLYNRTETNDTKSDIEALHKMLWNNV